MASAGGMATITRLACTVSLSETTVTLPEEWEIERTGLPSSTWLSLCAMRCEISCEPPRKRSCCAPPRVLISRSKLPGFDSFPAAAM